MPEQVKNMTEAAGEVLFDSVYVPAFLKQCEQRGVPISGPDDLSAAIDNVVLLKQAVAKESQQHSGSVMKQANDLLRGQLGSAPATTPTDDAQFTQVLEAVQPSEEMFKAADVLVAVGQAAPQE